MRDRNGDGQGPVFAPDSEDSETDHIEKVAGDVVITDAVEYSYLSGSHLIDHLDYKDGSDALASVAYSYDSDRDLVTSVKNVWGPNPNPNRQGGVSVCDP